MGSVAVLKLLLAAAAVAVAAAVMGHQRQPQVRQARQVGRWKTRYYAQVGFGQMPDAVGAGQQQVAGCVGLSGLHHCVEDHRRRCPDHLERPGLQKEGHRRGLLEGRQGYGWHQVDVTLQAGVSESNQCCSDGGELGHIVLSAAGLFPVFHCIPAHAAPVLLVAAATRAVLSVRPCVRVFDQRLQGRVVDCS